MNSPEARAAPGSVDVSVIVVNYNTRGAAARLPRRAARRDRVGCACRS